MISDVTGGTVIYHADDYRNFRSHMPDVTSGIVVYSFADYHNFRLHIGVFISPEGDIDYIFAEWSRIWPWCGSDP